MSPKCDVCLDTKIFILRARGGEPQREIKCPYCPSEKDELPLSAKDFYLTDKDNNDDFNY